MTDIVCANLRQKSGMRTLIYIENNKKSHRFVRRWLLGKVLCGHRVGVFRNRVVSVFEIIL